MMASMKSAKQIKRTRYDAVYGLQARPLEIPERRTRPIDAAASSTFPTNHGPTKYRPDLDVRSGFSNTFCVPQCFLPTVMLPSYLSGAAGLGLGLRS